MDTIPGTCVDTCRSTLPFQDQKKRRPITPVSYSTPTSIHLNWPKIVLWHALYSLSPHRLTPPPVSPPSPPPSSPPSPPSTSYFPSCVLHNLKPLAHKNSSHPRWPHSTLIQIAHQVSHGLLWEGRLNALDRNPHKSF